VAQPTNRNPLDFEAQTKEPSWWFWDSNHQNRATILRHKPKNPPPPYFLGSTKKPTVGFKAKPGETVATRAKLEKTIAADFKTKPLETVTASFVAKPLETIATGFEVKPTKTVWVVLIPNHSQTVDLGL
jgi:hypothetical protein